VVDSDKNSLLSKSSSKEQIQKSLNEEEACLEELSQELIKDSPDLKLIKKLTGQLGIPFSEDPVSQIDFVLKAVNITMHDKIKNRELEG